MGNKLSGAVGPLPVDPLLTIKDVVSAVQLSRSHVYALIAKSEFPRPVRVGHRSSRWRASDIQRYIDGLTAAGSGEEGAA